jgi:hypothetical protein
MSGDSQAMSSQSTLLNISLEKRRDAFSSLEKRRDAFSYHTFGFMKKKSRPYCELTLGQPTEMAFIY